MKGSQPLHASVFTLLACLVSCSLRSLDYLESGEAGAGAGATAGSAVMDSGGTSGGGGANSAGGGGSGKAGAAATGGGGGSTSAMGGTGTAGSTSNTGGASGSSSSGGNGGSIDPSGGMDAGGGDTGGAGSGDGGAGEGGVPNCVAGEPGCPPTLAEEIPYILRPGHALEKCVDIQGFSVIGGGNAIQYTCYQQTNQVFWAENHGDGRIALRNALSGKCLEVTGASVASNAPVEQWSCTGNSSQLFLPVAAGEGFVKLVAQHSDLLIDVEGDAPTDNLIPLVQNPDDGSPDMTWQLERSEVGAFVTLAANDQRDLLLRHDGDEVLMEASAEGGSEWKVVRGLANRNCVSFESRDDPTRYLRQSAFTFYREENDGTNAFALDATFCYRQPLEGSGSTTFSLESANYPGYYVARSEGSVVLQESDETVEFETAATWYFGQLEP